MNISNLSRVFLAFAFVVSFGMSSLSAMKQVVDINLELITNEMPKKLMAELQAEVGQGKVLSEGLRKALKEEVVKRFEGLLNYCKNSAQECNSLVNALCKLAWNREEKARLMVACMKPEQILSFVDEQQKDPSKKLKSFVIPAVVAQMAIEEIDDDVLKERVVVLLLDRTLKFVNDLVDHLVNKRMEAKVVNIVEEIYRLQQKAQDVVLARLIDICKDITTFKGDEFEQQLKNIPNNSVVGFLKQKVLLNLEQKAMPAQIIDFINKKKNLKISEEVAKKKQAAADLKNEQEKQNKLNKRAQKQEAEKKAKEQSANIFAAPLNEEKLVELKPEESQISDPRKESPKSDYSDISKSDISKVETKSTQSNQSARVSNSIDEAAEGEKPESPTLCQKVATRQPDIIDPKIEISIKDLEAIGFTRDQRVWISPKKLKYNGLGAVQHVLQHNHEKSDKYTHTVFKTSSYIETLELIDEAWAKIKGKNKESHKYSGTYDYAREGASANAQAYVADMGRTIGINDETRILIVTLGCHDDTIVTAYPFQ